MLSNEVGRLADSVQLKVLSRYAQALLQSGREQEAITLRRKSVKLFEEHYGSYHRETIEALYDLGDAYSSVRNFDSLAYYWNETARRYERIGGNHHALALTYNNLSTNYYLQTRYYESYHYIKKAVENWEQVASGYPEFLSAGYDNLGTALGPEEGIPYLKKSLNIKLEQGMDPFRSYIELGKKYEEKEQFDKALQFLEKGLASLRQTMIEKSGSSYDYEYDLMVIYSVISSVCFELGNHDRALNLMDNAITVAQNRGFEIKNNQFKIKKAGLLSSIDRDQDGLELAMSIFNQNTDTPLYGYLTNMIASIQAKMENYEQALIFNQYSIEYNRSYTTNQSPQKFVKAYFKSDLPITYNAAISISNHAFYLKKYATSNSKKEREKLTILKTALQNIQQSILLFQEAQSLDGGSYYAKRKFNQAIDRKQAILFSLFDITDNETYLEKAFDTSETGKFNTTLLNFNNYKITQLASVPEDLMDKDRKLKADIAQLKNNIYYYELYNDPTKDSLPNKDYEKLIQTKKEYQELLALFSQDYPEYFKIKHDLRTVSIEALQKNIETGQLLVDFYMGEQTLYIYEVGKDFFKGRTLVNNENLSKLIGSFRNLIQDPKTNITEVKQKGLELYNHLLRESLEGKEYEELIIAPDKQLSTIPFEALTEDEAYLIEDYTISYAYSATLWNRQRLKKPSAEKRFWAGFAPSYQETSKINGLSDSYVASRSEHSKLPGAKIEVDQINTLLDGAVFYDDDATKKKFKEQASQFQILHLAMHALLENEDPLFSKLIFTETDSPQENYLTISELYSMQLNADLAVLSACNTGYGKILPGEGLMSLSQAFISSGCPSTVTTLWQIPDIKSTALMVDFYKDLNNGSDKASALRNAKLNYLRSTRTEKATHPYYWAAFLLSGNDDPLVSQSNIWASPWFLVAFVLLIAGFFIYKKKTKSTL